VDLFLGEENSLS